MVKPKVPKLSLQSICPDDKHLNAYLPFIKAQTRPMYRTLVRRYSKMLDPIDLVTGIEKKELLAHLAGDCDPFRIMAIKKGPGTRERPTLIPSAYCQRLICCNCDPDQNHVEYMWLHQGVPRRCYCGYWFELCPIAPLDQ